jgi:hypothetical protein
MSLSVSSFPEAPPKPVPQPKWQVITSLKSSGRQLGTLLSKRSVPFVKGIGHFAKTHVKGSIIRQRAKVSRSRSIFKHHSSLSRSSSIVIDITPISNNDKFSARSVDVDASSSSLNPTIEISLSPATSEAALSTPTAAKDIPAISSADPVKASYQSSVQSLVGDSAHAHKLSQTVVQHPEKEHEEVASDDSEPHDAQPPDSEITTPLPISPSLTTQSLAVPVLSTEVHRRSLSASAGVKASATETGSPTLPRHKSETAIGLPRTTMTPSGDPSSSEGKGSSSRGENPIPQPPVTGSTHTSESTSMKKRRQQQQPETISKRARARSGPSNKSAGSNEAVESPPLLNAHMLSMRSVGSRLSANSHRPSTAPPLQSFSLSATALVPKSSPEQQMDLLQGPPHLRPKTSDIAASARSRSAPSLAPVGPVPLHDASGQSRLPTRSSVERARWLRLVAVPHAESWDGERQRLGRLPRTAPEAVLMASW